MIIIYNLFNKYFTNQTNKSENEWKALTTHMKQHPDVNKMDDATKVFILNPPIKAKFIQWVVYTTNLALMVW